MDRTRPTPRPRRWILIAAVAAVIATGVGSGIASGAPCCYGTANWTPSGTYTGGLSSLTASSFSQSAGSDHVVGTIWVLTSASEFVEQGIGLDQQNGLHWYWAELSNCGSGTYQEHITALSVSYNTAYNSKISYNTGGKWAVYRNGSFVSNSTTCHSTTVHSASTGLEASLSGDTGSGTSASLQKRGSDGVTWSYNWGGATLQQTNASASWITQYASLNWSKP